jgi:hypothetical protein
MNSAVMIGRLSLRDATGTARFLTQREELLPLKAAPLGRANAHNTAPKLPFPLREGRRFTAG